MEEHLVPKDGDSVATQGFVESARKQLVAWREAGMTEEELASLIQPQISFLLMMRDNDAEDPAFTFSPENGWWN